MLQSTLAPVTCISSFLHDSFVEPATDKSSFRKLFGASLRYLLKLHSSNEYQARLRELGTPIEGLAIKDIRMQLINSTYFCCDFKIFALSLIYKCPRDKYELGRRAECYSIHETDAKNAWEAIKYLEHMGEVAEIASSLINHPESRSIFNLENVQADVDAFTPALLKYSMQKVQRKLWFVYTYNNLEPEDLAKEMVCKAINAYYKMLPHTMSWDHLLNSLRSSCNRHALNLINYYTAAKRERLTNNDGDKTGASGNSLLVVSENQIRNRATSFTDLADMSAGGAVDVFTGHTDRILVQQIGEYALANCSPKKNTFLNLLSGAYDPNFSAELQNEGYVGDNDDLLEELPINEYIGLTAKYLGVTVKETQSFLTEMRLKFS